MTTEIRQRQALGAGLKAVGVAEGLAHLLEGALAGHLTPDEAEHCERAIALARALVPMMTALILDAARELPESATGLPAWAATTGRPN